MNEVQATNKQLRTLFAEIAGKHIKKRREELGWTQEFLAEQTGGDTDHIGKLENGHKVPSGPTLFNILIELELTPDGIFVEYKKVRKDFLNKLNDSY